MGVPIKSGSSGNEADVNINKQLEVVTPIVENQSGFSAMTAENDAGDITGTRSMKAIEVSNDYRLRVGSDNMVFNELFPGSAINTALWQTITTTMTSTVTGNFLNLNAGLSVASGAVARVQTYRSFPCYKTYTTYFEQEVQFTQTPVTGNVCEWGAFIATGTATPTDGCFFRLTSSGELRCVINNNGAETVSDVLSFDTLIGTNTTRAFLIYVVSNIAQFWIDNILVAEIPAPAGQGVTTASMNLPMTFRNYNSSATGVAQVMKVSMVNVTLGDQGMAKPWSHVMAGAGAHISQGQTGQVMGSTSLYTNSLAPGAGAAMTNTTAALGTGLGGQFSAQPTLAVGTDGIVCSYQVPLGTSAVPGKSLYITRININAAVTTALTGGPVVYAYSLAYGHTSVSLATTESASTKAPRRMVVGLQTFPATAAVGTIGTLLGLDFAAPVLVQPGEFIQIVAKNIGVVTSAGVITFYVGFGGYWE